jgi:molybdate transport system substrate-binding protein
MAPLLAAAAVAARPSASTARLQREPRGEVHVAVAANFADVQARLAAMFTAGTGHTVVVSSGSSGQLYAQIRNGAPFEVFLSADTVRPARLERDGLTLPGSRFTYALGRLVLYGPSFDSVRAGGADLLDPRVRHVAIANPRTAPYGEAAMQTLERLGSSGHPGRRLVLGENIAQTFQFVSTGAAELGFVAMSQVLNAPARRYWIVPDGHHAAIAQDAVLLRGAQSDPAALAYHAFLRGATARRVIASAGYGSP